MSDLSHDENFLYLDNINVNDLVVILHCSSAMLSSEEIEYLSVLFFTTACESVILKKIQFK